MDRSRIALIVGLVISVLGIALFLDASNLATHWQSIGENAWGGETDPSTVHAYQTLGLIGLAFGLFMVGSAFWRWLTDPRRSDREMRDESGASRRIGRAAL